MHFLPSDVNFRSAVFGLLGLLGLFVSTAAVAEDAKPARAVGDGDQSAAAAWLDCTFGPVPERESVHLLIMTVGDRVERAVVEPLGMAQVDVRGLKVEGSRIVGRLVIGHEPLRQNKSVPRLATQMPLHIDLQIVGGRVRGEFKGSWPSPKQIDEPLAVMGEVSGVRRDEHALRSDFALPDDAVWPSYVGPHQNFSSGSCDRRLVGDLNDARLVWASQYIGPPESGSQRYGACVGVREAAGGASPLVFGGRIYQFRYQASGDAYQSHLDKQLAGDRAERWREEMEAVGWTEADMRRRWAIDADEELVCIDGATGRTLWTVSWPGEGINLYDHKCSLTNHTGVVAEGKVFVFGALGVVRCVDADNGKLLWRTEVPGYADYMQAFKAKALEQRNIWAPTRSFCHGLNISGDTVIAPDGIGECGLVGLSADTGEVKWRVPKVLGKAATPLAWRCEQRNCVIAANASGDITCIDSASGDLVWRTDEAGDNEYSVILLGDLLFGQKLKREEREQVSHFDDPGGIHSAPGRNYGQVACWRLTSDGPQSVWTAPAEWGAPANCAVGAASGELVCFRGKFSYYLVEAESGKRVASTHLPTPVRWDEGHLLALPGLFVLHPDSQHGHTKTFALPAAAGARASPMWTPPQPHATTYQAPMSHAWADGRLFLRGADALYCYDLRGNRPQH
ncbi:MAG: PQQ-like beta-propeller repeat protein [Pirellulaceae bacterium]